MIFDPFGINVFHGGETIQGERIHRRSRFFSNTGRPAPPQPATLGCDELDVPETPYPLKAIGGQPRNPA
jgi:hypothetical protein